MRWTDKRPTGPCGTMIYPVAHNAEPGTEKVLVAVSLEFAAGELIVMRTTHGRVVKPLTRVDDLDGMLWMHPVDNVNDVDGVAIRHDALERQLWKVAA